MRNQVQLITYADRLGGTIAGTARVVREYFGGAVGGVHILPFFTPFDGADAGFDPVDHTQVDPRLGTWADMRDLARTHDTVVDVIVNHVSADSEAYRDVLERGEESPFHSMFLTFDTVFPDGATEADLTAIYRPRPGLPFTPARWGTRQRLAWTTFTPQQIDIDVNSEPGAAYLERVLDALRDASVTLVRLDAVGYAIKTPGTSSFMTPETFAFIDRFTALARERGMEVLVEVHSYYRRQVEIAARVDRVYDFALPPLILHALHALDAKPLRRWLEERPTNAVTVLDTHDGIGVIDVGADHGPDGGPGLLAPDQLDALVESIHEASGGQSRQATGAAASNLDIYQVNCTFYDALGGDDRAYLAARCLQLFTPGIPQVYYVGALAGRNDMELLERSGVGRDINRHHYSTDDLHEAFARPVVQGLLGLMGLRSEHPAFDGECDLGGSGSVIELAWRQGDDVARAAVDVADASVELRWSLDDGSEAVCHDLMDAEALARR